MLEVTVKTLDSQNHSFTVPEESTVSEFKNQIAPVLNIAADKQRLIFCGKVLKDDKKLSEYDVNGKVIHVVQSLPPSSNSSSSSSSGSSQNTANNSASRNPRDAAGFLLGAFTIPQEMVDPTQVQNIVQDVVSGMGDIGRNATVMSRASDDGSVDVHINLGRVPVQVPLQSEAQLRMNRVQTMLIRANHLLESLEDGANSNNGNVADSSSQTENGGEEAQHSPIEAESSTFNAADDATPSTSETLPPSDEISSTGSGGIEVTSEITIGDSPVGSSTDGFEGLTQAAQAAISAAFANVAVVAARATASLSSPTTSTTSTTTPPEIDSMDTTSSQDPIPNFPDVQILDPTLMPVSDLPVDADVLPEQPEPASGTDSENSGHHPECPLNSSRTPPSGSSPTWRWLRPSPRVQPSVQTLANLLDEVIRVNTRLQPWLEKCRDLVRNDSVLTGRALGDSHRLFSRVSQLMHFLSHAYHSLSDLHINFSLPPPRSPRVRIISSTHTSSLFPVQAQISISGPMPSSSTNTSATTTNADSTGSTNAGARSTPQTTPSGTRSETTAPRVTAPTVIPTTSTGNISFVSRASNPLVFMDVTPVSVSIDTITSMPPISVSSNVTSSIPSTTSAPATSTTTTTSGSNEPASTENTESSRANATTSTGAFTSPARQPINPINLPLRSLIPVPLSSMGSLHTFDAGLPCHSVWALEPARRRHNAGGSRPTSNAAPTANVTPNVPGRQEEQLHQIVSNIMMSLLNHTPAVPSNAGITVLTPRADSSGNGSDNAAFLNAYNLSNPVLRDTAARVFAEGLESSPNAREGITHFGIHYDDTMELFDSLGLSGMKLVDATHSQNIPDSIRECFDFNLTGLLGDICAFLINHITFRDLINVSYGRYTCLDWLREPFQRFLHEKVFRTQDPQEKDIHSVTRQISSELELGLHSFRGQAMSRFGMNFLEALTPCILTFVRRFLEAALSSSNSASVSYGNRLAAVGEDFFREFMSLNESQTWNANRIVEEFMRDIVDPLAEVISLSRPYIRLTDSRVRIKAWLITCVNRFMYKFGPKETANEISDPRRPQLIRLPPREISIEGQRPTNETRATSAERSRINRPSPNVRRLNIEGIGNVVAGGDVVAGGLSGTRPLSSLPLARIAEATAALLRSSARPSDNSSPNNSAVSELVHLGSDAWHSSVPRHWVPFIDRDVQRQRRQAPQAPFSDAYLSGMPSKRRKIMTNGNPTLLEPSQNALSDMLGQAISSAGVRPRTSIEEVKRDASQNAPLQASFTDHMKHAIQERLQRDLDYCSERFPNSEKYFN